MNNKNMRHVVKAKLNLIQSGNELERFIKLENTEDNLGVTPIVSFFIQSDPISEVGVNGCQAVDMLEYTKFLFESLNEAFPCIENDLTIKKIEEAIHWQNERTKDRERRKVEGKNEA